MFLCDVNMVGLVVVSGLDGVEIGVEIFCIVGMEECWIEGVDMFGIVVVEICLIVVFVESKEGIN